MNVIYKITCVETQKYYIGSTVNKNQRWARHRKDLRTGIHKNKHMQNAWAKHGEAAFLFEVLEIVEETAQLMVVEQRYLDTCVGQPDCFNHNPYADSPWRGRKGEGTPNFGRKWPDETRQRMSAGMSGENHPNFGKKQPADVVEKIRAANLAYPHNERRHTPEAIAQIVATSKGRPQSLATRYKRSQSMQGHEVTTMTRMKISRSLMGENNPRFGKPREAGFVEKVSKPLIATHPSGVETQYPSITAFRAATGLLPSTINNALKSGKPLARGPYKGWGFRYLPNP